MMNPKHERKLVISGVSLTKTRLNKYGIQALTVARDELEACIISSNYLDGAPFLWVSIILRYGLISATKPIFKGINKTHGDLAIAIEIDTAKIINADLPTLASIFKKSALIALIYAGKKYDRPIKQLESLLEETTRHEQ